MRHLVFSRSNLLHHKQRQSDKPETIAKILHRNARSYQMHIGRLHHRKESISHKRKIEDAAESEQSLLQSELRYINASQQ